MGIALVPKPEKKPPKALPVVKAKISKPVIVEAPKEQKKKRKRATKKTEQPQIKELDSAEESDNEDDLLAAAREWANNNDPDDIEQSRWHSKKEEVTITEPTDKIFSLHLTQLSYEANEYEIRTVFAEAGCLISSIRLVYDGIGTERTFRGVAFLDVCDELSYKKALSLNRRMLLGRKMNVRPTKTKEELTDIVARTKELVTTLIQRQKDKQEEKDNPKGDKKSDRKEKRKGDKKAISKLGNDKSKRKNEADSTASKTSRTKSTTTIKLGASELKEQPKKKPKIEDNNTDTKGKAPKSDAKKPGAVSETPKLTKKERNRRAAILMSKGKGK